MTRKERQRALLQLKMDPQGFEKRAHEAISKLLDLKITDSQKFNKLEKRAREKRPVRRDLRKRSLRPVR